MKEKSVTINSYGKINLSLDVGRPMADGMHPVDTVMQQISLADKVTVKIALDTKGEQEPAESGVRESAEISTVRPTITLTCNNPSIPTDEKNFAYRAAQLMLEEFTPTGEMLFKAGLSKEDKVNRSIIEQTLAIEINIEKNIPTEAGLAGGSGNAAAVLLGLNYLWNLNLTLEELLKLATKLGSDMPFCLLGQASANEFLQGSFVYKDILPSTAARGQGTGTKLKPCNPLKAFVLIGKPKEGVSTKEVYRGMDDIFDILSEEEIKRPNNDILVNGLERESLEMVKKQMINLLELYTLEKRKDVNLLKKTLKSISARPIKILMSGSGPSVYGIFERESDMRETETWLREAIKEIPQLKDRVEIYTCKTI